MTERRAGRGPRHWMGLRRWAVALVLLALAAALILTWKFTPLGEALSPQRIAGRLDAIETSSWAPLYFIAVGITLAWIALSLLLQRWIARRKPAG